MAEVTVKQLAQVVGTPVEKLLEQLKEAGVVKAAESDVVSDEEKYALLQHLRNARGQPAAAAPAESTGKKITLRRKRRSALPSDSSGRKTVNIEVRGRRTVVNPADAESAQEAPAEELIDEPDYEADSVESQQEDFAAVESPVAEDAEASHSEEPAEIVESAEVEQPIDSAEPADEAPAATDAAPASVDANAAAEARIRAEAEAAMAAAAASAEASNSEASSAAPAAAPAPAAPARSAPSTEQSRMDIARREFAEKQAREAAERQAERQVSSQRRQETEEQQRKEAEQKAAQRAIEEAQRRAAAEAQQAASGDSNANAGRGRGKGRGKGKAGGGAGAGDTRYGRNQLHVSKEKSGRRKGKSRRSAPANFEAKHGFEMPTAPVVRDVEVPETITVAELANRMAVKAAEVIKAMMGMGVMATINQMLDQDTAILVVEEMGHNATSMSADDVEAELAMRISGERTGDESPRPPVVTVMGHVDHGKTSLLDYIRNARIASGEAGGITQHIGAYQAETDTGVITFLDTPGHAAFTSMRQRGAQATDIVILVCAADDGVMPQTIEAVKHSKAAGVPIVVAVNKMDKEGADPERVKNELAAHDVIPEDWGGDTQFIPVSALTGNGIDTLLEAVNLQAEVLELTAHEEGNATGIVIEATLDKGRGPVATVLVQNGTLNRGDTVLCGQVTGRVRAMFDENGQQIDAAGPSTPVQLLGLSSTPNAGDEMLVAADEKSARELAELREGKQRDQRLAGRKPQKLEDVFSQIKSGETPTVNIVVKADVKGSFEAICDSLEDLSTDEVSVRVVGGGVGGITESDATLAATSNAFLVGFNTRADSRARRVIQEHDIELQYYSVIYELIDLIKSVAGGLLPPEIRERIIGTAEVRDVFTSPKFGQIAGCMVVDGVVKRDAPIRVLRDNVVIYEGELESLRRFKDDVKEVNMGTECGIGVKNYTDVKPGDSIEVFERTEVARTL